MISALIYQALIIYLVRFRVAAIVISVLSILGHSWLAIYQAIILG